MKWIAAQVTFLGPNINGPGIDLPTDLVADIFYSLDLKGVVVDDPRLDSTQDWGKNALPPPDKPGVTGYFADTPTAAVKCQTLETALKRLQTTNGISTAVTYTRIDEQDWAEAWKEHFWPEKITESIVVKPSWRNYDGRPEEIIIEIDPGMAFGTGTHPTTALCIRMIENHLETGNAFLDIGTGSGILMIAAAKLGAAGVCGVDNDDVAVGVAENNLLANNIDCFALTGGNLVENVNETFDVVAANILAEVILDLLPDVVSVLKPKGIFICSGIITARKDAVLSGLQDKGFEVVEILEKEDWVAIASQRSVFTV